MLSQTIFRFYIHTKRDNVLSMVMWKKCIKYDIESMTFFMVCSDFFLRNSTDFGMNNYVTLVKNETFEGNNNRILLSTRSPYQGLFRIKTSGESYRASSLKDAPVIRNLHIVGGITERNAGLFIQSRQKHFNHGIM